MTESCLQFTAVFDEKKSDPTNSDGDSWRFLNWSYMLVSHMLNVK